MDGGDPAGGSAELAKLIDKHGEELISDFLYYYRVDIRDVLIPGSGLSARRAVSLVRNLPPDSATVAALRGGSEFRGWSTDRYLLAGILDAVRENTHALIAANSRRVPKAPEPVTRPEKAVENKNKPSMFRMMAAKRLQKSREAKER